jgi:hypothetical protein
MANSLRSIVRRRIERGVTFVLISVLKCDSRYILVAAAFSTVAIDGVARIGASWRGNTSHGVVNCSGVVSTYTDPPENCRIRLSARCVVSPDLGPPEEIRPDDTSEVGAVDWRLSGAMLLPFEGCDRREEAPAVGGATILGTLFIGLSGLDVRTVGLDCSFGRRTTVLFCRSGKDTREDRCLDNPGVDLLARRDLGRGGSSPVLGSDSPSRPVALVSCRSEVVPRCRERSRAMRGISGALGQLKSGGPPSAAFSIWGRWVASDLFELELPLATVPGLELDGETEPVSSETVLLE